MRWQTTAALAVILAALAAFFYVYEVRMAGEREQVETRKGRVLTVDSADVTEITLERPADTVRVKREGEGWQLLTPVQARADRATIDEVLTTLTTAKSDREIEAAPAASALADFGLDKPAARVTLVLKNGRKEGLVLGGKSPTGAWVYAREADKAPIFSLGESVLKDATRPPADFRDKTLLAVERKDVTALEVVTRDETIAFANDQNKWTLAKPRPLPADPDVVREFFDKLAAARIREFVADAPGSLAPYELDRPTRVTIVTGKDKDRAAKTLLFGRVDAQKKGVHVMREGDKTVLLVPDDLWTAVPKTVATARDKTVVAFDRDKVAKLEVQSEKGTVTLARENDRWRITAPEALPADQVEAGAILFKLKELKAQAFLSEDASALSRFLAKPAVRVTVTETGAEPKTVLVAPSDEKRGGAPSAYAGVAGQGPVVLVDGKALAELGRSLTDLRDHSVLMSLEPKDVRRVALRAGGKSVLLEKSGEAWTMLEPTKGAAKSQKVDDLLYTLRLLKWKEVAAAAADAGKHGFDQPALEVSLYRADGTEISTLTIGKDRAYVKTKAAPTVFTIDPKTLGELPKIPDDLKG